MLLNSENQQHHFSYLPPIPRENRTDHWFSTTKNPSEDNWLIRSDSFVERDKSAPRGLSIDYLITLDWLANRFAYSMEMGHALGDCYARYEVLLSIRPCNNAKSLRKDVELLQAFSYKNLAKKVQKEGAIDTASTKLARKILKPVFQSLEETKKKKRPSHIIVTYDDDTSILLACTHLRDNDDFYPDYLRSKGLIS